jgi:rhodanese-related sulfurtransferase
MIKSISPSQLREWILDDQELALLDVREEGEFSADGHLLFAVCLPLSRLETGIGELVPRKMVRMVVCDDGRGSAEVAIRRLDEWGYKNISKLEGGTVGWESAGYTLFRGVNVPSKAFGEFVEHHSMTPSIAPEDLKTLLDAKEDVIVLDSRPWAEYQRMNIPTAIDCPGAELVYRFHEIVDRPETTVVVNCAGRTRSIIGAQSLINAGVENPVFALRNGTMGWALAGFELEYRSNRKFPDLTYKSLEQTQDQVKNILKRLKIEETNLDNVKDWCRGLDERTLFLLDVRNPEEYAAGHLPGSINAPGGQLIQATDRWVGVMGARLVLIDDTGVRAGMTASWLSQMGWGSVYVLRGVTEFDGLETAISRPLMPDPPKKVELISAVAASHAIEKGATVIDFATSLEYKSGHIPGALWAVRSRLADSLKAITGDGQLICTCPDGVLAIYAAADLTELTERSVLLLDGGTASWQASGFALAEGFEKLTTENNDIQYKAYDYDDNVEEHMNEYLSWEIGLVDLLRVDGTARFRHFSN